MKIDGVNILPHTNNVKAVSSPRMTERDFSSIIKIREANAQSVNIPKNTNKELVQDFAEWYFKQGRTYETTKSYKQAISAYEKSNSVEPDINKTSSIDQVRKKEYGK